MPEPFLRLLIGEDRAERAEEIAPAADLAVEVECLCAIGIV